MSFPPNRGGMIKRWSSASPPSSLYRWALLGLNKWITYSPFSLKVNICLNLAYIIRATHQVILLVILRYPHNIHLWMNDHKWICTCSNRSFQHINVVLTSFYMILLQTLVSFFTLSHDLLKIWRCLGYCLSIYQTNGFVILCCPNKYQSMLSMWWFTRHCWRKWIHDMTLVCFSQVPIMWLYIFGLVNCHIDMYSAY